MRGCPPTTRSSSRRGYRKQEQEPLDASLEATATPALAPYNSELETMLVMELALTFSQRERSALVDSQARHRLVEAMGYMREKARLQCGQRWGRGLARGTPQQGTGAAHQEGGVLHGRQVLSGDLRLHLRRVMPCT